MQFFQSAELLESHEFSASAMISGPWLGALSTCDEAGLHST